MGFETIDTKNVASIVVYEKDEDSEYEVAALKRFLSKLEKEHSKLLRLFTLTEEDFKEHFSYDDLKRKIKIYLQNQLYELRKEIFG